MTRPKINTTLSSSPTGRTPSNGPNIQNIPVHTEDGRHIREAFVKAEARASQGYIDIQRQDDIRSLRKSASSYQFQRCTGTLDPDGYRCYVFHEDAADEQAKRNERWRGWHIEISPSGLVTGTVQQRYIDRQIEDVRGLSYTEVTYLAQFTDE